MVHVTMIRLITCVTPVGDKWAIGHQGKLLFQLKHDMAFFKKMTTQAQLPFSRLTQNIVLMGRKTWSSLPPRYRPLPNRLNLILTSNPTLLNSTPLPEDLTKDKDDNATSFYYVTMDQVQRIMETYHPHIVVIGGSDLYHRFMTGPIKATTLHVTLVQTEEGHDIPFDVVPDTLMNTPDSSYTWVDQSPFHYDVFRQASGEVRIKYQFLTYQNLLK